MSGGCFFRKRQLKNIGLRERNQGKFVLFKYVCMYVCNQLFIHEQTALQQLKYYIFIYTI